MRTLTNVAVQNNMIAHQKDVKSAYLNADTNREVFMDQAEGYVKAASKGGKLMYKVNKSLYGLTQSARNWNSVLNYFLLKISFT